MAVVTVVYMFSFAFDLGNRLPAGGLILDGDPSGKQEPDVLLLISENGDAAETADEPGR